MAQIRLQPDIAKRLKKRQGEFEIRPSLTELANFFIQKGLELQTEPIKQKGGK